MAETTAQRFRRLIQETARKQSLPVGFQTPSQKLISIARGRSGGGGGSRGGGRSRRGDSGAAERARAEAKRKADLEVKRKAEARRKREDDIIRKDMEIKKRQAQLLREARRGGTISALEEKKGLEGLQEKLGRARRKGRGKEVALAPFLGFGSVLLGTARFGRQVITKPIQTAKSIPGGVKAIFESVRRGELARVIREEPGFVTGAVAGEILITKGGQVVVVKGGRATGAITARLTPGFKRVQTIKTEAGLERVIKNLKGISKKGELRIIPVGGGDVGKIVTKGSSVIKNTKLFKSVFENLKKLEKRGGIKVSIKGTGEKRKLVTDLKSGKMTGKAILQLRRLGGKVDIPIRPRKVKGKLTPPSIRGGFRFSKKEQLAIFRKMKSGPAVHAGKGVFGTITKRKIKIKRGEERAELGFFATPPVKGIGFIRESRLGLGQKVGRFRDLITGEVTVGKVKPQIIVVPESKGFKGIGFKESTELETTLKPGLILKRVKSAGTTVLGKGVGQRVPIIIANVVKAPKSSVLLFNKAKRGAKLTAKQRIKIKKLTGFSASELSKSFIPKRRISPSALIASVARIRRSRTAVTRRTVPPRRLPPPRRVPTRPRPKPRPTPRPRPRPPKRPPTRITPRPPSKIIKRPPALPPARPPIRIIRRPPIRPPIFIPENFKAKLKKLKKKKKFSKGDVALVQGFTAKLLGLKGVRITKANLRQQIKRFQTIGLRRAPVFVKASIRRRKKR